METAARETHEGKLVENSLLIFITSYPYIIFIPKALLY